jgi:hypothetical protein
MGSPSLVKRKPMTDLEKREAIVDMVGRLQRYCITRGIPIINSPHAVQVFVGMVAE